MTRDAATTIRHLKTLGETIESALVASLGGAFVSASVFKYIELSAELPDDDDAQVDAKAEIVEKSKTFAVRLAEIEKSSAGNVPLPPNAAATPDAPRWPLPKEKPITHDGEVETFPAFWKLFRKRVLKKVPDKEMKHVLLCQAVSSADLKHIAGLSLTKSKEFLLKKYTSASAVRGYLVKKFEKPQMCHEDDAEGLMELREATATALLVASECDNTDVLPELFDLAYCRLPREVQRRLMKRVKPHMRCDWIWLVDPFLEDELEELLDHRVICRSQTNDDDESMTESKPEAMPEKKHEVCYFCGEEGHVAMQCDALAKMNCKGCGKFGHTKKFCEKANQKRSVGLIAKPQQPMRSDAKCWRNHTMTETSTEFDNKPRCRVAVGDKQGVGVVDTGSDPTSFPEWMVETDAPLQCFLMADGKTVFWMRGPVELEVTVAGVTFVHPVYVRKGREAIIGSDLLDKYGGVIDYATESLKFLKPPMPKETKRAIEMHDNDDELRRKQDANAEMVWVTTGAVSSSSTDVKTKKETPMMKPTKMCCPSRSRSQRAAEKDKKPTWTTQPSESKGQRVPEKEKQSTTMSSPSRPRWSRVDEKERKPTMTKWPSQPKGQRAPESAKQMTLNTSRQEDQVVERVKLPSMTIWASRSRDERVPEAKKPMSYPSEPISRCADKESKLMSRLSKPIRRDDDKEVKQPSGWMDGLEMIDIAEDGPIQSNPRSLTKILKGLLRLDTAEPVDNATSPRTDELDAVRKTTEATQRRRPDKSEKPRCQPMRTR